MLWTILGYALGFIFLGFVAGAAYKLWLYIPTRPKEKKPEQEQKEGY